MMRASRDDSRGFTLIELLIVVAIIGIIAAMLIPNFLDSMQKAKQKRTVADMNITGTAMMAWLTDAVAAGAAGQSSTVEMANYPLLTLPELREQLRPQYLQEIIPRDGWKEPFEYYMKITDPFARQVFAIRSLGRDSVAEGDSYEPGPFTVTDYDRDIVWTDGFLVRWPANLNQN